ncbi:hypothetical protein AXG93_2278s1380 [Marchantia polymorpha subsp. ruderalis]|uniref:FAD-dependent oxidoreductase domain-containing protein 1 n=1 Tax=Marchantia polymorpha subsp. ruderalis TaxID=1480154 RepID=A0A176WFN6_MARPO|nr:hypothetical protein AXG93_2278s1380 [Marchantia polymorpha subsp. ruderalis]
MECLLTSGVGSACLRPGAGVGVSAQGQWRRAFFGSDREVKLRKCWSERRARRFATSASVVEYDVVIVGAGVIGVATAHHILTTTPLSVALVDAREPCAGATGAGQGYIWMTHRKPGTPGWHLAKRSKALWETFAMEVEDSGLNPTEALGWRKTGSLLVASTDEQAKYLQNWAQVLSEAGAATDFLTHLEAVNMEPALATGCLTAAALCHDDLQIDARLTIDTLLQSPVQHFIRSSREGRLIGVEIPEGKVFGKSAVVIATGAWSSLLMKTATTEWGMSLVPPMKPRKGHLLVIEGTHDIQLKSGIMECEYLSYNSQSSKSTEATTEPGPSIVMTATLDPNGNLLLGSYREFAGFNIDVQDEVIEKMVERAARFLPGVSNMEGRVRTGLRPYINDGRPMIGPVDDVPGLIFATGHEGSGLCLSLATAEMVTNIIQDVKGPVESAPFLPNGRLSSSTM